MFKLNTKGIEYAREDDKKNVHQRYYLSYLKESNIPSRYIKTKTVKKNADFEQNKKALFNYCKSWQDGSVVMLGGVGTGKTHLACKLLLEYCKALYLVRYFTVRDITLELRQCFNEKQSEKQLLDYYACLDCIVIDELGNSKVSEYQFDVLFQIINTRYNDMKPTVVISNNTISELTKLYGKATMDRLLSDALVLNFNYASFRR